MKFKFSFRMPFLAPVRILVLIIIFFIPSLSYIHAQSQSMQTFVSGDQLLGIHRVAPKQTLYGIAKMYNMSVDDLMKLNELSGPGIFPGNKLWVVIEKNVQAQTTGRNVTPNIGNRPAAVVTNPVTQTRQAANQGELTDIDILATIPSMGYNPYEDNRQTQTQTQTQNRATRPNTNSYPVYQTDRNVQQDSRILRNEYYRVQQGDNMYSIANRYNISVDKLRGWNAKFEVNPGDIIVVRKYYDERNPSEVADPVIYRGASNPQTYNPYTNNYNIGNTNPRTINSTHSTRQLITAPTNTSTVYHDVTPTYGPSGSGNFVEEGSYIVFESNPRLGNPFYAIHKNLSPGSKLRLELPNQSGYLNIHVVGYLPRSSQAIVGLSQAVIDILRDFGSPSSVRILY